MIDKVNTGLSAVADVRGEVDMHVDLEWYGFDPYAPLPPDNGLTTVEVNDVNLHLSNEVIESLRSA